MSLPTEHDTICFDLERAKKIASAYSQTTNIECSIIDSQGHSLFGSVDCNVNCKFCRKVKSLLNGQLDCEKALLYGSYQAERFGGKYIFFCPMGLVHWASPITCDGIMKAAMLGGPVLMVEPEEFLMDDVIRKNNINDSNIDELKQYISEIPVIQPDVVNSLAEMLFIVAVHISDLQPSKYLEEREMYAQQSDISDYIYYIKTMGGDESKLEGYPLDKEKELLSLISMGDKTAPKKVLNEILGHIFFSTGGNFEVIKARVLELIVLLSRAALTGGADVEQIFGLNYKYLEQIHKFETVEELSAWLSGIMVRFTDCVFNLTDVKHVDVIYKAIDYVKRSYMKKITLEEVASHVYLSPSYFSKIFKDEMKCNFNTYLNNVRIDMSKRLLLDDSVAIVDIANLVGYEDQSYFSKVFKKVTNVSPGKFRESRGKLKV
jgi:two-component system, response regulator YesN